MHCIFNNWVIVTLCILYMVQRLVLVCLLVFKKLVQSVSLENAFRLIREEDGVTIEGNTQLSLRHFLHLLRGEHGGCCYTWFTHSILHTHCSTCTQTEFNSCCCWKSVTYHQILEAHIRHYNWHLPPQSSFTDLPPELLAPWLGQQTGIS